MITDSVHITNMINENSSKLFDVTFKNLGDVHGCGYITIEMTVFGLKRFYSGLINCKNIRYTTFSCGYERHYNMHVTKTHISTSDDIVNFYFMCDARHEFVTDDKPNIIYATINEYNGFEQLYLSLYNNRKL